MENTVVNKSDCQKECHAKKKMAHLWTIGVKYGYCDMLAP